MNRSWMIALVALLCLGTEPVAAGPAGEPQLGNCYNAATETVETRYVGECAGRMVSDEEAERIRQDRIGRTRHALQVQPPPVDPALRMVSSGTGFFVTRDAAIVTNNHVVAGCSAVTVETTTDAVAAARVAAADPATDLALLKADVIPPALAEFRGEVEATGQEIAVIGYPDHGLQAIRPVIVTGLLVGLDPAAGRRLAFHADVRPGNSGGPLLDDKGLVIGVVFGRIDSVKAYQKTGTLVREVGYAISNQVLFGFLDRQNVEVRKTGQGTRLVGYQLYDKAKLFVARIGCWR